MIVPRYIVGFSGHRRLMNIEAVRQGIRSTLAELKAKAQAAGGRLVLFSSAASGADLLALEAAREIGLDVHIILPLTEEDFRNDFVDESGRLDEAQWQRSIGQVVLARSNRETDSVRVLPTRAPRPECYHETALKMIDACDLMLTVWDGEAARGLGGTGEFHRLARERGRPHISLNPATGRMEFQENLPATWPERDAVVDALNASIFKKHPRPTEDNAASVFARLEEAANRRAPEFRRSASRIIWINAAATLVGATSGMFTAWLEGVLAPQKQWIPAMAFNAMELLLVLAALAVVIWIKFRKVRGEWLQARFATELVRAVKASLGWLDPLQPQVALTAPQWRRFALTAGLMCGAPAAPTETLEQRKQTYLTRRLEEQIRHFREKGAPAERSNGRFAALTILAAWLAPLVVMMALALKIHYPDWSAGTFWGSFSTKFLPVVLPLSAGTAAALRATMDYSRRSRRYPALARRLETLAGGFSGMQTEYTAREVVRQTESLLLDELLDWQIVARSAGIR